MYKLILFLIVLHINNTEETFKNFSLPSLPSLPSFFGHTTAVPPIVIINPFPSPQYGHEGHHHGYKRGDYYLIIEGTEVPYVNHNFVDGVSFQVQKFNSTLAGCIGSVNLKRHIYQATLITRLYGCQIDHQCNTYISEIPRQPLCNFMTENQYDYEYAYRFLNQQSVCNNIPTPSYGCNLPEGVYQFMVYIPVNIVPQQIPGQKWKMDCYMATSGKRIATFSLYLRCSRKGENQWISSSSLQPVIITSGVVQVPNFERYASAIKSSKLET